MTIGVTTNLYASTFLRGHVATSINVQNTYWGGGWKTKKYYCGATNGDNQLQVTNELAEFVKSLVEVQDLRKITNHSQRIYRIYPTLVKKNKRLQHVGFGSNEILTDYAPKSPQTLLWSPCCLP